MAEQGLFKTAMRGFRKEDVLNYIDELLAAQSAEREGWESRLEALTKELAEANVQKEAVLENETLKARLEVLEQQLSDAAEQVTALSLRLETAEAANQAASENESAIAGELEEARQTIAALSEEKDALEAKLSNADVLAEQLRAIGAEFCHRIQDVVPTEEAEPEITTAEQAIQKAAFDDAGPKMESWLF